MQLPQSEVKSNINQLESQDGTQLTSGGTPGPREFEAGDIVDGTYEIISLIGSGGMGNVYRARHSIMHQEYALKTLSAEQVNETAWRRFQNEAQAIARMNHANVVGIYNLGLHDGHLPFYVMDLLKGHTLLDILRAQGALSLNQAMSIFAEVGAGLAYAHKKGIVHRDIKPGNIVIMDDYDNGGSRIKIVDFGIAKLSGIKDQRNQELTSVGEICGSPFYMSPEQCNGGRIDARSDIYSFGCTLFEALTGVPPFKGRTAVETMLMHQNAKRPTLKSVTGKSFPLMLENAIATMLAPVAMDRYQNMELIVRDLTVIKEGRSEAINPYITQAHKKFDGREEQTSADDQSDVKAEKKRKAFVVAGTIALTIGVGATVIAGAVALYSFLTPKSPQATSTIQTTTINAAPNNTEAARAAKACGIASDTASNSGSEIYDGMGTISNVGENQPKASLADKQLFSTRLTKDDVPSISFDFPKEFTMGTLTISNGGTVNALSNYVFPANLKLIFSPASVLAKYPQYCRRFQAGDLYAVMVTPPADSLDVVKSISLIKGVKQLIIKNCSALDDTCVDDLSKMITVTELSANDSGITGKGLARLSFIKRLTVLSDNAGTEANSLCAALAGTNNLRDLELQQVALDHKCFQDLSTIKSLKLLSFKGAPISDEDLQELAKLPKLRRLTAPACGIGLDQIAILKTFPSLKQLDIRCNKISKRDVAAICRALPGVEVQ